MKQQGLVPAEAEEKGGFSYVELNEKKSPRGEEALKYLKKSFKSGFSQVLEARLPTVGLPGWPLVWQLWH